MDTVFLNKVFLTGVAVAFLRCRLYYCIVNVIHIVVSLVKNLEGKKVEQAQITNRQIKKQRCKQAINRKVDAKNQQIGSFNG